MHIPVLQREVLQYLDPKPNENFIDCTFGEGGYAAAILEKIEPNGKVLGIEIDPELVKIAGQKFSKIKNRLILVNDSYVDLERFVEKYKFKTQGILFDLGMSSWHLGESGKGFSFLKNESLDMRYNSQNPLTAEKILNFYSEIEIEKILREYGEERFSQQIAKNIIDFRQIKPIKTTPQLVEIIKASIPKRFQHRHTRQIHPATRTFQALRIAVNNELNNFESALPQALKALSRGGRLVVISFHSLEDRIVKNFFREKQKENLIKILTKKPISPSHQERRINPRSRSAKLRAAIKINPNN
jgi:16S rRNA (cytosine1402-N4)-methyltransferase